MKTTSLELSKQLKEAGFSQKAEFYWGEDHEGARKFSHRKFKDYSVSGLVRKEVFYHKALDGGNDILEDFIVGAAPTAEEILDELPVRQKVSMNKTDYIMSLTIVKHNNCWGMAYGDHGHYAVTGREQESLADVAAKYWLYLKKEGLI